LGHEPAGEIVEVGADVADLRVGDRVVDRRVPDGQVDPVAVVVVLAGAGEEREQGPAARTPRHPGPRHSGLVPGPELVGGAGALDAVDPGVLDPGTVGAAQPAADAARPAPARVRADRIRVRRPTGRAASGR
jgi:hypothetical protein